MVAKVGDRVTVDGVKVGQARRSGVVREVTEGLSGTRLRVMWDDGHETTFSPGGGNLIVEARRGRASNGRPARAPAPSKKSAPKATAARAKAPPRASTRTANSAAKKATPKPKPKAKAPAKSKSKAKGSTKTARKRGR